MWRLLLCVLLCGWSSGHKILLMFPIASKSHSILGEGYVRHLLAAGHEVTYITPYPLKNPPANFRQVDLSTNQGKFMSQVINLRAILDGVTSGDNSAEMVKLLAEYTNRTIAHENFQRFILDTSQEFDAVVVEWLFSEAYAGLAAVFNCPLIWSSSVEPHSLVLSLIDERVNPAYNPDLTSRDTNPLTFVQRARSLVKNSIGLFLKTFIARPSEKQAYETYFGPAILARGRTIPPFGELIYNGSLMLGNSHVSLGEPARLPQSYIPIGGYHVDTDLKPLPKNIQKIMDDAKDGVVYFSMGSILKSADWPVEIKRGLLQMFGQLKQTVIWKFEEDLEDVPKNVHIMKWTPQGAILNHTNCAVFITHGGLLSITEAIHYAVPIIGIPVFADQFTNIGRAVNKGFAVEVSLTYDVVDDLKKAIDDVLGDAKYRTKVSQLSFVYHDRPTPPGAELSHWVRHVVLTKGAPHLRSPALLLSWYQKTYLDLIAIVVVTQAVVITIAMKTLGSLCRKKVESAKKRN